MVSKDERFDSLILIMWSRTSAHVSRSSEVRAATPGAGSLRFLHISRIESNALASWGGVYGFPKTKKVALTIGLKTRIVVEQNQPTHKNADWRVCRCPIQVRSQVITLGGDKIHFYSVFKANFSEQNTAPECPPWLRVWSDPVHEITGSLPQMARICNSSKSDIYSVQAQNRSRK